MPKKVPRLRRKIDGKNEPDPKITAFTSKNAQYSAKIIGLFCDFYEQSKNIIKIPSICSDIKREKYYNHNQDKKVVRAYR